MFVKKQAQFIPHRKFSTGSCKIDLYFPEHKLAIECDEHSVMIKMSLSVQCSVVEQFSFNGKKIQSVHVKVEECLVSRNVYMAIGYEEENGKKTIKNLVPSKYKLRFGDVRPSLN